MPTPPWNLVGKALNRVGVHEKADWYEVGQHPLVSSLLKGAFNQQPPKPRYEVTWDVTKALNYIDSLGESDSLSLQIQNWP